MKSVALNPLQLQRLGDRKDSRDFRQIGMKRGVEARYLRGRRKMFSCEADDRKSRWNVQRRKGARRFKLPKDLIVNEAMAPELWSAMHDPMSHSDRSRHFDVGQKPCDADDRFPLARSGRGLREQHMIARIPNDEFAFLVVEGLGLSGEQNF